MSLETIGLTVGATLCWALTWVLMKLGVDRMNWVGFGFLRPWIGLLFIVPFALLTNSLTFASPVLILIALGGSLLNTFVGTALFYYALAHGSLHESTILSNTNPFWGVVSSVLVLGEPARWFTFGAGGLVIGGAYFLVRRGRGEANADGRRILARLAALGAGVLWGFTAAVPSKYCLAHGMSPIEYHFLFTCGATVWWTVAALPGLRAGRIRFTARTFWLVFASSFFGLFLSWILWLTALQRVEASALSPLWGLALLFTVLFGVVILGERLTKRVLVGGALVLAGVTLVSLLAG